MRTKWIMGLVLLVILGRGAVFAQESQQPLTLEESIKIALERDPSLHSAATGVLGSEYRRKGAATNFLPQWTGEYGHTKYSSLRRGTSATGISARNVFDFNTTAAEPIFTGGKNLSNYRLEKLGVDISKMTVETVRNDIVLEVRQGYFNILRFLKLLDVAAQNVKLFESQLNVSKSFFEVGIVAKNDVLQAEVNLANAKQGLVKAENDLALAKSSFNILLRRDINTPFNVVDILEYKAFPLPFEESVEEALRQRSEIKSADFTVKQAEENVKIARSGFFPTISIAGNYDRTSDRALLNEGMESERWALQTLATFTIFDWGNTYFKVGESKVKVTQAKDSKTQRVDSIVLEVKQGYLNMLTAEKNIGVAQKAIEQADENLRMNEERYKYQVATATDVQNAVTLLTQARTNYYGTLADFNIAKAQLERAMGRMYP